MAHNAWKSSGTTIAVYDSTYMVCYYKFLPMAESFGLLPCFGPVTLHFRY
jgi:hypothetical protein